MGQTDRGQQPPSWMDDGTGISQAEIALREGVALLGSALVLLLRAFDTVLEAWPLPTSRVQRRHS